MKKIVPFYLTLILWGLLNSAFAEGAKSVEESPCLTPIFLTGSIEDKMLGNFTGHVTLPCLGAGKPGATVVVASSGGSLYPALGIFDSIGLFGQRNNLTTLALGQVASAAVIVFLAGDRRKISCNTVIFLHPITRATPGGELSEAALVELQESVRGLNEPYMRIVSERTTMSLSTIRDAMARGRSLNATEAVKYGFAQEIVGCPEKP